MIGAFLFTLDNCVMYFSPPSYVVKGSLHYIDFVRQEKKFFYFSCISFTSKKRATLMRGSFFSLFQHIYHLIVSVSFNFHGNFNCLFLRLNQP